MPRGLSVSSEDNTEAYVKRLTTRTFKHNIKASEAAQAQVDKKRQTRERLQLKLIEKRIEQARSAEKASGKSKWSFT